MSFDLQYREGRAVTFGPKFEAQTLAIHASAAAKSALDIMAVEWAAAELPLKDQDAAGVIRRRLGELIVRCCWAMHDLAYRAEIDIIDEWDRLCSEIKRRDHV